MSSKNMLNSCDVRKKINRIVIMVELKNAIKILSFKRRNKQISVISIYLTCYLPVYDLVVHNKSIVKDCNSATFRMWKQ